MSASAGNAGGPQDRDYLDKVLDAVEKKFGGQRFAGPDASQKNRAMNEKITEFIRKGIEKITGYPLPTSSLKATMLGLTMMENAGRRCQANSPIKGWGKINALWFYGHVGHWASISK